MKNIKRKIKLPFICLLLVALFQFLPSYLNFSITKSHAQNTPPISKKTTKIADGITLEVGYFYVKKMIDGKRNDARFETPRDLKLSADGKHILIFDSNGYLARAMDSKGNVKTTKISLNNYPKKDMRTFKQGYSLLASPANNTLLQISPDFQTYLFAGERKTGQEQDAELLGNVVNGEAKKPRFTELSKTKFNIPMDVTPLKSGGWLYKDGMFKNHLNYIDTQGNVHNIQGLEWLTDADRVVGLAVNKSGKGNMVYVFGEQAVYQIKLDIKNKRAKKITQWNNEQNQQFHELTDLVAHKNTIIAIDRSAGTVIQLQKNNQSKILYQSPCSDTMLEKTDYICEPSASAASIPFKTGFSGIIKNPWGKGYFISDSDNNVIYKFVDNKLTVFSGQFSPDTVLPDSKKPTFISECNELIIENDNKYCVSSLTSFVLDTNKKITTFKVYLTFWEGATLHNGIIYSADNRGVYKSHINNQTSEVWGKEHDEGFADGDIADAKFNGANDIIFANNYFYVADRDNRRIRKVSLEGKVTTAYKFPEPPKKKQADAECDCDNKYKGMPTKIIKNGDTVRILDFSGFVYDFNIKNNKVTELFKLPEYISPNSATLDKDNNIWLIDDHKRIYKITAKGVIYLVLSHKSDQWKNENSKINDSHTIDVAMPLMRSLAFDSQENLWIGTDTGLIKVVNAQLTSFK